MKWSKQAIWLICLFLNSVLFAAGSTFRPSNFYATIPLAFEANEGQADSRAKFLVRGRRQTIFLTSNGAVLVLRNAERGATALRMNFLGTSEKLRITGEEQLPGKVNYFTGNDPEKWRTNIRTYAKVRYQELYPGIDLVYYGNQGELEYDLVVQPGADPAGVTLGFAGAERITIDEQGDLLLHTETGSLRHRKPICFQEVGGIRRELPGRYQIKGKNKVGFEVEEYDRSRALIIDPVLVYSTYLGGGNRDVISGIAVDSIGSAYVTGWTLSADFPVTAGAFDTSINGQADVFVTKLDPSGSTLIYSTYIGGGGEEIPEAIAIDSVGNSYISGHTVSTDFPTTVGSFDTSFNGVRDAFVTKLNSSGSVLLYSTFLGGGGDDDGVFIAVDTGGNAYVTGFTHSANFPTTAASFDTTLAGPSDAFVTKLNSTGSAPLLYSTYLGGSSDEFGYGLAVDSGGSAYVSGRTSSADFPTTAAAFDTSINGPPDAFLTKLNSAGSAPLLYSTFLGGSGDDNASAIAVDAGGNTYAMGHTSSGNFPTTAGAFDTTHNGGYDVFLAKLNSVGSAPLIYSTYLGGGGDDICLGSAIDTGGNAYVTGYTQSANFPTTATAFDTTLDGPADTFVTKLNGVGSAPLVYSTYLGGSSEEWAWDVVVDSVANAYVAGFTSSVDFPTTTGAYSETFNGGANDAFVVKIRDAGAPATLTLDPPVATNPVDTQHCVTATVRDSAGNPVPDVIVRFTVTGSVSTSGSDTTDEAGQATFCYFGPAFPGEDVITAYADVDEDDVQDAGEPTGSASKTWVLPVTTPLCEILIANGGKITAANGDRATFGGNAKSSEESETQGQQEYQDHGPAQPLNMHSINVLAIVCEGTSQATIYGDANVDGSGPHKYRIRVRDVAEPGVGKDTYELLLSTGYTSGDKLLEGGNIQIHHK